MRRILLSLLCVAAVTLLATPVVGAAASSASAHHEVSGGRSVTIHLAATPHKSYWTFTMKWDGVAPTPDTYLLKPLIKTGNKLTGTVLPPNTACPGTISGTLSKKGALKITITYPGTGCNGDKAVLTGHMNMKKGTAKGTFTANYHCPGTCKFVGKKTAS